MEDVLAWAQVSRPRAVPRLPPGQSARRVGHERESREGRGQEALTKVTLKLGPMISTQVSRASAVVLLLGGLALLFAPDALLPRLVPGFPPAGAWLGQLLAAAWLGVAALNWTSQRAVLGGIYGRPVVLSNAALYFISATSLARAAARDGPAALWALLALTAAFAAGYGWLLLRGPVASDLDRHRQAPA